jgi:hypothetical protein
MVNKDLEEIIMDHLHQRVNHILDVFELTVEPSKYQKVRKVVLDEFGNKGFSTDLKQILGGMEWSGTGRNIHAGTEVPK